MLDRQLFDAAIEITVGSGAIANFWKDRWLHGFVPRVIAPTLYAISYRKNRSVEQALKENKWLADLARGLTFEMLPELAQLATLLDEVILNPEVPDTIRWRWTQSGKYPLKSAYLAQFEGSTFSELASMIWSGWAPSKCRFFLWTSAMNRIMTADALQRRGWENGYFCPLCMRSLETPMHLLVECPWVHQVWAKLASLVRVDAILPNSWAGVSSITAWLKHYTTNPIQRWKGTHSLVMLAS